MSYEDGGRKKAGPEISSLIIFVRFKEDIPHMLHVGYIYLHLVVFNGKNMVNVGVYIYHTWMLWVLV